MLATTEHFINPAACQEVEQVKQHTIKGSIKVGLPGNLFYGWMKDRPYINPSYDAVKEESDEWLIRACNMDSEMSRKTRLLDMPYMCAVLAPHAEPKILRVLFDHGSWFFPFDDNFDRGDVKTDTVAARVLIDDILTVIAEDSPSARVHSAVQPAHVHAYRDIWTRLTAIDGCPGSRSRLASAMSRYLQGVFDQVNDAARGIIPSPEMVLDTHERALAMDAIYALAEWAEDLHLPDEIFTHPLTRELMTAGGVLATMQNDLISYRKEEAKDEIFGNIVASLRMQGASAQEAFDLVGKLLDENYRWFESVVEGLRAMEWSEAGISMKMEQYITIVKDCVKANLWWHFHTKRYFGAKGEEVRSEGKVEVQAHPAYLLPIRRATTITEVELI